MLITILCNRSRGRSNNYILVVRTVEDDVIKHKFVGPRYCGAEMYAGRVACCPLLSQ